MSEVAEVSAGVGPVQAAGVETLLAELAAQEHAGHVADGRLRRFLALGPVARFGLAFAVAGALAALSSGLLLLLDVLPG